MGKLKDYTNMVFGQFKVIKDLGIKNSCGDKLYHYVISKCIDCGYECEAMLNNVKRMHKKCKCQHIDRSTLDWKLKPLENDIGLFIVIKDLGMKKRNTGKRKRYRECIVQCKKCLKQQQGEYSSFRSLHRSCECQQVPEFTPERKRIYKIHFGMLTRCYDAQSKSYKYYGARGITVCDEWLHSYEPFYEWSINNGYFNELTIDRIDSNGNYEPSNCRWSDSKTQGRNKRHVISIEKVKEIKRLLNEGYTHHTIATIVKTTHHRVSLISKGASWKDI